MVNPCLHIRSLQDELATINLYLKIGKNHSSQPELVRLAQRKLEIHKAVETHSGACSACAEYFVWEEAAIHLADAIDGHLDEELPLGSALK